MRRVAATLFGVLILAFAGHAQTDAAAVKSFRDARDEVFRDPARSPLRSDLLKSFKGLEYFPPDARFVVGARFEKTDGTQVFLIPTNFGTTRRYVKAGVLSFEIDGAKLTLIAFRHESSGGKGQLFVPFRDSTSGRETYSAGRYLEITEPSEGDVVKIDFNFAYNPSCAYGDESYSCTLPPKENFLGVAVKAGEKSYSPAAVTH